MPKLTDTQAIILSRAASRPDNLAMPLPDGLAGAAAKMAVTAMINRGWLEEVVADLRRHEPLWRETGDGHGTTLVATQTGLAAIGIAPESADCAPTGATEAPAEDTETDAAAETKPAHKERKPRDGTKQALLIEMLRAEGGATIEEIVATTGWQSHTVRGAIAGALKKKLGLDVRSEKIAGRGRVYQIG